MTPSTLSKRSRIGKKKVRQAYKPKIRWELLGLASPELEPTTSIDTIRKGVSSLASQGFESGPARLQERTAKKGRSRTRK